MREQLRIGGRLSWAIVWALALAAPALYLIWPGTMTWWLGLALVLPLVGLVAWRADSKGSPGMGYGVGDDGPWAPPPG